MYIYLNPQYVIRNENNCSYIIAKSALITAKLEYAMAFVKRSSTFYWIYLVTYWRRRIKCFNRKI